ncbi:hypothetical protein F442_09997 [Phytophthora nicotianae P10297]|uniref:Tc1-like transposase DDE domain-containing protein n=1 Tax=Phytophthora nicotianae P10297 TaxID=1317064 RepID=W2Z781_PHYNI|nr:hypothetical protein F442_09997 [Phytophthora nicotianae P10297]
MTFSVDLRWRAIVLVYVYNIDRNVCNFVKKYVTANPCFYFEELREELRVSFSDLLNISDSSIYRALRFDLGLTRKVLAKRDSESIPRERREYVQRLLPYYCGPDQLVFVDETSKDARSELRKYGWSARNTPAYASLPFSRGSRVSVLAALDVTGFFLVGSR